MIARAIFSALLLAFAACAHAQTPEERLFEAIEKGMKELVELMVKAGAPLGARSANGETPLHVAALHADSWYVDLLLMAKADPKARNDDGESVLQWAVMTGNPQGAKNLLLAGADPLATDLKGNTLLHAAADGGHEGWCTRSYRSGWIRGSATGRVSGPSRWRGIAATGRS